MAYPFPKVATAPQTPQHIQGIESPQINSNAHHEKLIMANKRLVLLTVLSLAFIVWLIDPFSHTVKGTDQIPFSPGLVDDYFNHFEGHQDCGITSSDIYVRPRNLDGDAIRAHPYCRDRATLLEAASGGGRHGFDVPFHPIGCHYRWYTTTEICMILDRFDTVIFIGDAMLQAIYSGFNMLLRENIAMGGLKQWELTESERTTCRCDNQMIKSECSKHSIKSSEEVQENDGASGHRSPYFCSRLPHVFLPIKGSPAPEDLRETFKGILSTNPDSYKPVPVIHSLSLATSLSWPQATASMDEWVGIADASTRAVPFLWIGPNAAGHLKPPGQIMSQGNNALWHYTMEMAKEAESRGLDALEMYNLTMQATSWDGSGYGQKRKKNPAD
ncbi:hypothetical protein MMC14_003886 [Varicellaria rhodocarpa]|nr:hypothetical protein [Varicellaria rhodocarpa]